MTSNVIQVSRRQTGNALLKHITRCPWSYADIEPDYVVGRTACALFLSIRYHAQCPNYIYERINKIGENYDLRILLVFVDHVEHNSYLKELSKLCIRCNFTLMLCWTIEDAAMYLEKYKLSEDKPADVIMEKPTNYEYEDALDQYMIDALAESRSVNRTDSASIVAMFDKFTRIAAATPEELAICPGVGLQKAQRLYELLHKPMKRGGEPSRSSQQKSSHQAQDAEFNEDDIEFEPRTFDDKPQESSETANASVTSDKTNESSSSQPIKTD